MRWDLQGIVNRLGDLEGAAHGLDIYATGLTLGSLCLWRLWPRLSLV